MIIGLPLAALQGYLLILAVRSRGFGVNLLGTVLFAVAALVLICEIYLMVRVRDPARRWLAYPIGFVGLVLVGSLLVPLLAVQF